MEKTKDNSNMWMVISALCLALGIAGSIMYTNSTKSLVTEEAVLTATNAQEFVAVIKGDYNDGIINVDVEANVPDGTILSIISGHVENEEISQGEVTIERGVGSTTIEISKDLLPSYVNLTAILDMKAQGNSVSSLATERYGVNGELLEGDNIYTIDGVSLVGIVEGEPVAYPSEEILDEHLELTFNLLMEELVQMSVGMISKVEPVENEDWSTINVTFEDEFIEMEWNNFMAAHPFYLFEESPKIFKIVDEDVEIKVNFLDSKGNIIETNY